MPGTKVSYGGTLWTVGAIGVTGGERYVWLVDGNCVAMIPASMFEDDSESHQTPRDSAGRRDF